MVDYIDYQKAVREAQEAVSSLTDLDLHKIAFEAILAVKLKRPDDNDYQKSVSETQGAISCLTDPDLRKIAFEAILAEKLSHPMSYWKFKENRRGLLISAVLATGGILSLWLQWKALVSYITIIGTDVFILYLLIIVGLHADRRANTYKQLPHRLPALFMCGLLFVGLLHAFGNLYQNENIHCPPASECRIGQNQTPCGISCSDALYFSTITMTTVGYGDFYPADSGGRKIVIWQLANSVMLVVLLLPLVVSRFASF